MKKHMALGATLMAAGVVVTASAFGQETNAAALYDAVKEHYRQIKTFKADFSCEIRLFESATNRVTGRLAIEPPAKWRMHLESPAVKAGDKPTLVVFDLCDGANRWTYDAGSQSILKRGGQQAENVRPKNFFPAFEMYDGRSVTWVKEEGAHVFLKLNSVKDLQQFAAVVLDVDRQATVVEKMEFIDWKGRTSMKISFANINVNKPAEEGVFNPVGMPDLPVTTVQPESSKMKEGEKK